MLSLSNQMFWRTWYLASWRLYHIQYVIQTNMTNIIFGEMYIVCYISVYIDPLHVEIILGSVKIYLHFLAFLHMEMAQEVEICSWLIKAIQWFPGVLFYLHGLTLIPAWVSSTHTQRNGSYNVTILLNHCCTLRRWAFPLFWGLGKFHCPERCPQLAGKTNVTDTPPIYVW